MESFGTRLLITCLVVSWSAASAQSPPPRETTAQTAETIEEITITARRREESLQDTPVAVTALSAAAR